MLYLLGVHIIVLIVFHILGYIFYRYLLSTTLPSSFNIVLTGLVITALIGQLISIFYSYGFEYSLLLLGLFFFLGILDKNYRNNLLKNIKKIAALPPFLIVIGISLYFLFLLLSSGPIIMDDSESYHIQMVKWIQDYGSVPGVANLHSRYGFHSSWFNVVAFFSPQGNKNYFTVVNSFTGSLFSLYLLWFSYKSIIRNKIAIAFSSAFLVLFLLLFWPFLRAGMQNMNYDYIFSICTIILLISAIEKEENHLIPVLFLWPVFLVTVRVLYFPALLLTFYSIYYLIKQNKAYQLFVLTMTSILLLFPFLIRNTILSGYPIYPSAIGKFFSFDWEVPEKQADSLINYIKYYNRVNNRYLSIEETKHITFPSWIIYWAKYLFYYDKILLCLNMPAFILIATRIRKFNFTSFQKLFGLFLITQTGVWFFIAPDPRFIYGVFFSGLFLSVLLFVELIQNYFRSFLKTLTTAVFILITSFSLLIIAQKIRQNSNYRNFLSPADLPKPDVTTLRIDSVTFNIPHKVGNNWNCRCYALSIPCVYDSLPGVQLRGKDISHGFYIQEIKNRHVP